MGAKSFEALVELVRAIWKTYDIQCVVLTSLTLQFLLVLLAPLRKRSKNGLVLVLLIIWLCYLLADYCATFGTGLISREGSSHGHIVAFWAPFLLLHLGAPHNITALSMEDNILWQRHLLTLIVQVPLVLFVFYHYQIHKSGLLLPAVFTLAAGIFKYAERVYSLYLTSLTSIRMEILFGSANYDYSELAHSLFGETTKPDELEILQRCYYYYKCFIGFVIDHTFARLDEDVAKKFFSRISYDDAFKVIEVELNFMYDAIFTKMVTIQYVTLSSSVVQFGCHALIVIVAVIFFFIPKHSIDPRDIYITYTLLGGALVLDFISFVNVIFSEWTIPLLKFKALELKRAWHWNKERLPIGTWIQRWIWSRITSPKTVSTINTANNKISSSKRWSRKMSQYSLINHSLNRRWKYMDRILIYFKLKERIDSYQYTTTTPIECYLMREVFEYTKTKGHLESIRSQNLGPLSRTIPLLRCQNQYDKCLLVFHVATEICYFTLKKEEGDPNPEMCRDISEYLAYLLLMEGRITTTVPGMRFRDILWEEVVDIYDELEATFELRRVSHLDYIKYMMNSTLKDTRHFFTRNKNAAAGNTCSRKRTRREQWEDSQRKETCEWLLKEYDEGRMLLNYNSAIDQIMLDVFKVQKCLKDYSKNNPDDTRPEDVENQNQTSNVESCPEKRVWEYLSKVWIELLLYTASQCRGDAQYLSRGGEFLTFVRLLMAHFGLREWFKEGQFQLDAQFL